MSDEPPNRLPGTEPVQINIVGCVVACDEDGATGAIMIHGTNRWAVPIFSSMEAFNRARTELELPLDGPIRVIKDGAEFLAAIPDEMDIVKDLRPHDDPVKRAAGGVRYQKVLRGGHE